MEAQLGWPPSVIGVDKCNMFTSRHRDTTVASIGRPAILLSHDTNAFITKRATHLQGAIDRSVVNDDQFKILKRLIKNRLNGVTDTTFGIVSG